MFKLIHNHSYESSWSNIGSSTFGYCFVSCTQSLVIFAQRVKHRIERILLRTTNIMLSVADNEKDWRLIETGFNNQRRGIPKRTWRRHSAMLSLMQRQDLH